MLEKKSAKVADGTKCGDHKWCQNSRCIEQTMLIADATRIAGDSQKLWWTMLCVLILGFTSFMVIRYVMNKKEETVLDINQNAA